ncbi:extracellular mutant protein 11-domain-containing protein [Cercophora newfieldiana]|uniref:Extracellular mutant protein 11-domain-containing protein n=1 Tax=Cercophora newfieldiana TaxID=92897 RepID=A0AA39Y4F7_9PEZI|nr:extracellular mutant protein 11-domain-containing protein [Cercophora newfieldiana]
MRLRMMPTAKKKLGGIPSLFTRQSDSVGPSPRLGVVGSGLPATPAPQRELLQLQPAPEIVTAPRQDHPPASRLAVRSIPVPKHTGTMSLPPSQLHFHPMQRTRTSASDAGGEPRRTTQNAWEDSTVASMFGDAEGRPPSDKHRGQVAALGNHNRHYSDAPFQRPGAHLSPPIRNNRQSAQPQEDSVPFVIEDGGLLRIIQQPVVRGGPAAATLNNPIPATFMHEPPALELGELYQEDQQPFDTTPTKHNPLRRTRLPHREARRDSFGAQSSDAQSLGLSPERPNDAGNQIERVRLEERVQERVRRERERQRDLERDRNRELERELHHKRSTVFENLTPVIDEGTFDNTRAAVKAPESSNSSPRSNNEAVQRTPRPPRQPLPALPQSAYQGNGNNPLKLGGGSLSRTGTRNLKETASNDRKRRLELDYDDAELAKMSFSDLRKQAFDYDPQLAAMQQQEQIVKTPAGTATLEEQLEHYKTQGSVAQHQFFTQIGVDEWEEAGDWFLARFSDVVGKMRKARRAKRQLVEGFEVDIAMREEAVRGKMEGIAKTLEELKEGGQTMMEGRDTDLEA